MAGSYKHAVNDQGQLRNSTNISIAAENLGDAFETMEEMYGMIWYLARGSAGHVEWARRHYIDGISMSPGVEPEV